jgi:hypothetical protein
MERGRRSPASREGRRQPNLIEAMIKEQVLILRVRYDDEEDHTPHTWNWTELVGSDHEIEVLNHGSAQPCKD